MDAQELVRTSQRRRALPDPEAARAIRIAARLTEREIGAEVGVTAATVSRWERGTRTPRGRQFDAYATLLATLAEELARP